MIHAVLDVFLKAPLESLAAQGIRKYQLMIYAQCHICIMYHVIEHLSRAQKTGQKTRHELIHAPTVINSWHAGQMFQQSAQQSVTVGNSRQQSATVEQSQRANS